MEEVLCTVCRSFVASFTFCTGDGTSFRWEGWMVCV